MNLFDAIFANDAKLPAISYGQREIAYGELRSETLRMAQVISVLDAKPGDRVALLLHDSPEFVELFIAAVSLGAIAVPINMALSLKDQRTILHDCGAKIVIVEEDLCSTLLTDAPETLHFPSRTLIVERDLPKKDPLAAVGQEFWVTEEVLRHPPTTIDHLTPLLREVDSAGTTTIDFSSASNDEPSLILYTSGSTGEPKGAVHRQQDIFYTNKTFCAEVLQLTIADRLFSSSRLPFAYGLGNSLSFPLLNGATSILCSEKPAPKVIARIFTDCRPTIFFAVPVVYNLLLEYHRREQPLDCSSLRLCISAGEALPASLGEEWEKTFGVKVLDGIGSTEMQHMFMSNREDRLRYGSSGEVVTGYEARLVDENGSPTPAGAEGHLWIKGESAAMCYWERPVESARTFVNGWVRTGDLYKQDGDGFWYHMGRSDDCFKSSGQWVSPVEVEGVLLQHTGVARAAVVEDFDTDHLPYPCAFVVSQEVESDSQKLEGELRELAGVSLPRFKQPRKYVFVAELPYTATGKVQRFRLRQELRR
jgi:benzoate-CoA ligase family protein